jgi:hypothetical protein
MPKHRTSDKSILAQIPAAKARAERARRAEPHAAGVRYDARARLLHVDLTNGAGFHLPIACIPGLEQATENDLGVVQVGPAGIGLHWETLDIDVSVADLAQLVLGARTLLRAAGIAGGGVRSTAKAEAARRNGLKGGRPRKAAATVLVSRPTRRATAGQRRAPGPALRK